MNVDRDLIEAEPPPTPPATYILIAVGTIIAALLALDVGIRWGQAGARIDKRCEGDTAIYFGSIRGEGVLAVNGYDPRCAEQTPHADPTYPGDSQTKEPA